jgi:hypothetical protein
MPKLKQNGDVQVEGNAPHAAVGLDHQPASHQPTSNVPEAPPAGRQLRDVAVATAATVGVVAVGAVLLEAALIPGMVLGVAATIAPQLLPRMGAALNPLFRSTVRGAYKLGQKSRQVVAEAQEQFHDIMAEARAESGAKAAAMSSAEATAAPTI